MISLFIRSYPNDFEWLSHSIRSMRKNLKGISDSVLCVPMGSSIPNDISVFFNRIVYSHESLPGYLAQQVDKVKAYQYCQYNDILFSDSDCIYFQEFDATKMLDGNRVKLYQTKYTSLEGQVLVWQKITHKTVDILPEHEYMRCFPIMHKAKTCELLDTLPSYNHYLTTVKHRELSEFNALGVIAKNYLPDMYEFVDTETIGYPSITAKQYWSWGGITSDILKELETI